MNNGKICVSVGAETAAEMIEQIKRADQSADVIELRFDYLRADEIKKTIENLPKTNKQYLATFRPKEQGGKRDLTIKERLKFWEFFLLSNKDKGIWVDFEFDMNFIIKLEKTLTIASFHDFSSASENLPATGDFFSNINADVLKIAVRADDITDSIGVWKLLEEAKRKTDE